MAIKPGDRIPDFDLPTDGGGRLTRADLAGKRVVLYFYPKDDTPGCTREAQGFRAALADFAKLKVAVIGVSKDGVARHDKFKDKYDLPFTLVSDEEGALCQAFGVWIEKQNYGRTYMGIDRSTFLIDETGVVRTFWRKVKVDGHVQAVLAAARTL